VGDPVMQWQIVSKEPAKHAAFYSAVFGWSVTADNPMGYLIASTNAERGISGGFWPAPPEASAFVQLFVEVSDMSKTINSVTKNGGSILIPPQNLPEGEQMAILRDPMGVTFGIMTPRKKI
jgi:predicted enzyme related to lactoylglutathione lyase